MQEFHRRTVVFDERHGDARTWTVRLDDDFLSPELTLEIMELVMGISARGTTVMVATHELDLVSRYGKRTLRLEGGRIAEDVPAAGPGP